MEILNINFNTLIRYWFIIVGLFYGEQFSENNIQQYEGSFIKTNNFTNTTYNLVNNNITSVLQYNNSDFTTNNKHSDLIFIDYFKNNNNNINHNNNNSESIRNKKEVEYKGNDKRNKNHNQIPNHNKYCLTSSIELDCHLSIASIIISTVVVITNLIASIQIYRATNMFFKFEQNTLLSGIIENILLIVSTSYISIIILVVVFFLQILVTLFITRRFIKVYENIKSQHHSLHKWFYFISLFVNLSFLLFSIAFIIIGIYSEDDVDLLSGTIIFIAIYRGFSLICVFIMYKVGLDVRKALKIESKEVYKEFKNKDQAFSYAEKEITKTLIDSSITANTESVYKQPLPFEDFRGRKNTDKSKDSYIDECDVKKNNYHNTNNTNNDDNYENYIIESNIYTNYNTAYNTQNHNSITTANDHTNTKEKTDNIVTQNSNTQISKENKNNTERNVNTETTKNSLIEDTFIKTRLFTLSLLDLYFLKEDKYSVNFNIYSISESHAILEFLYRLSLTLPGLSYFIAFYILVRNSYKIRIKTNKNCSLEKNFLYSHDLFCFDEDNDYDTTSDLTIMNETNITNNISNNDTSHSSDKDFRFSINHSNKSKEKAFNKDIYDDYIEINLSGKKSKYSRESEENHNEMSRDSKFIRRSTTLANMRTSKEINNFLNE